MKACERLLLKIESQEKFVEEFKRILLELGLTLKEFLKFQGFHTAHYTKLFRGRILGSQL